MKSVKPKPYNWGANYTRLDSDIKVVPTPHRLFLCVRVVERITGYQSSDGFLSFVEYSQRKALGVDVGEVAPVHTIKSIFTLDMWGGGGAPWQHAHAGYCGFYRLPDVSGEYWHTDSRFAMDSQHLIWLNNPSMLESQGFDQVLPGLYLAQSYFGSDGFKNWAVHYPGFRWRSTGDFCINPSWGRVPDFNVDYWLPLPDLKCPLSFR